MMWLIWSNEHKAWWKPNSQGYCRLRKDAGRYTYEEAYATVKSANFLLGGEPNEAMVADEPTDQVTTERSQKR